MRILIFPWLFLITIVPISCITTIPKHSQCLEDQRTLLLQLKNSLKFNSNASTKMVQWNQSTDCCLWQGVTCDNAGHVIGLDLNSESISGGINNSSSLFSLQSLQMLNLAYNSFNFIQIPSGFSNLTSLTYLNLSYSDFSGQIPIELSRLASLVTLDLSHFYFSNGFLPLKLENPNLTIFVQNLTELTELYLDRVNISTPGYDWCQAISSSLPKLRVLSLKSCSLSGPIDSSLAKLQNLSVIDLSHNDLAAPVPEFLANFTNLTALRLSYCSLDGAFPEKIFKVPSLQTLDLSNNGLLGGSLPNSIGNLGMLSMMDIHSCNFSGLIPSFRMSKNLVCLDFSNNNLSGPIPSTHFEGLLNLVYINLGFNSFNGTIPSSLFALPSLESILLSNNHFDGSLAEFSTASSSVLDTLDLSRNKLGGPIPKSFFDLRMLNILLMSSNNLTGTIQLELIQRLSNLTLLDLSYNSLSINARGSNSSLSPLPQFSILKLASCGLQNFPDLRNQSQLFILDLSANQIGGEIPNWIWEVGDGSLQYLNLSHNLLVNLQEPYVFPRFNVLDLHSNHLRGVIPIPPLGVNYVDYSSNHFSSSIPADIGNFLGFAYFFSVSNNNLAGTIPESICKADSLQGLDLSNNSLSGLIPSCFNELNTYGTLEVLNLGRNNLSGNITVEFPSNCGLETLDLHGNLLEGKVPESLANCTMLEVLNLGNNQINDTFPCFLRNSSKLRVLVLRTNSFHGGIQCQGPNKSWPNLQIIDIASNYFTGDLPPQSFLNWTAMMNAEDDGNSELRHLRFQFLQPDVFNYQDIVTRDNRFYYQDGVTVTNKGLEMKLVKILTIFTAIDFSNNSFEGGIPHTIGELKWLYVLNLSHNAFTGPIPPSIGNLKQLGSLDLSVNMLSGVIPTDLASLTFLSVLNLSYNQLAGRIPKGPQIQTFTGASFEGNEGLCGFPLNKSCNDGEGTGMSPPRAEDDQSHPKTEINGDYVSAALGYVVGLGIVTGSLMCCSAWRKCYFKHVDHVVSRILLLQDQGGRNRRRRVYRNPIRRL